MNGNFDSTFKVFCAGCGREMEYRHAWWESLSKVPVCGEECLGTVQKGYVHGLLKRANPHTGEKNVS
jgi:hypothetical protein